MTLEDFIPVLQLSIGPVILISGVGLVLLSMTNRFGRIVDRTRKLAELIRKTPTNISQYKKQLEILTRRAHVLRLAIALASISLLIAAILIIALFFEVLMEIESAYFIVILFVLCMLSLILSLVAFITDINMSLTALKIEMQVEKE